MRNAYGSSSSFGQEKLRARVLACSQHRSTAVPQYLLLYVVLSERSSEEPMAANKLL